MATKALAPPALLALLAAIAAIVGGAAGWLLGATADRTPWPVPTSGSGPIVDELRRLGADLRALAARPANSHSSPPTERTDVAPDPGTTTGTPDERLLTAIEQLLIRVEQIATRQIADNGTLQRLAATRTVDTRALDELRQHIDRDWDAAQRELFLMPMAVVLQRFGPPRRVDLQSSGMQWGYDFTIGERSVWLGITFHDGVVVKVD